MTFRFNFLAQAAALMLWTSLQLVLYLIIFNYTKELAPNSGWTRYPYFVFLGTVMMLHSMMGAFLLPNMREFSEQIRTGNLDFAMVKPIDTQFLISFHRFEWSAIGNFLMGVTLVIYALVKMKYHPGFLEYILYPIYLCCGVGIMYSLLITLASASVWMIRNTSLENFWFYITTFSRQPIEIFKGSLGAPLRGFFSFLIPVLLVVNVPARLLAMPMTSAHWQLAFYTLGITVVGLFFSRWVFMRALGSYRSASS